MKNFTYITLILLIIASCGSPAPGDKNKSAAENESMLAPADSLTLNGYTFAEATSMVKEFRKDTVSSHARTSLWFSKAYIDSLSQILPKEGVDGFRIYFAKKNGKNDIVMVATKQTTIVNPDDPSKFVQQDYFELKSAFFKTGGRAEAGDIKHDAPPSGITIATAAECKEIPCNKSPNGISCTQGKKWVKQFQKAPINIKNLWYHINLIHYWKDELDAAVRKGKKGDGIRIYFAKKDTGKNAFVIVTTRDKGQKRSDYYNCFSDDKTKFLSVDDNGEECPNNCHGSTWQ
jgi:hypothetical protein